MTKTTSGGISTAERSALANLLRADLLAAAGGATCKLFKNNLVPTAMAKVSDFVEADFSGYSPYPLGNWQANLYRNEQARWIYNTQVAGYLASGLTLSQFVYGFYVVDTTLGTSLYGWGVFDDPVLFSLDGDVLVFMPLFKLPQTTGQWKV